MINYNINIRPWNINDDVSEITEMLHAAYKPLADHGLRYWASYQKEDETLDRLQKGDSFLLLEGNKIIGTISIVPPIKDTECEWLDRSDLRVFTQFAISPEFQGKGLGTKLLKYAEKYTACKGFRYLACDTAESANNLRDYYTRCGYDFIGYVKWNHTNYRSVVLSKELYE